MIGQGGHFINVRREYGIGTATATLVIVIDVLLCVLLLQGRSVQVSQPLVGIGGHHQVESRPSVRLL